MRLIWFIGIWLISCSVIHVNTSRPVFGVNVAIGPNSQLTSYVCFLESNGVLTKRRNYDRDSFVKIVSGHWPSIYNPQRINYFELNNIDCAMYLDSITLKQEVGCIPLDSLWKIRFATFPFRNNSEMGWSNLYHKPSLGQQVYLHDRYNIHHIDGDYFLDTNFWRILQDVNDTNWIANYKAIN
ncbi:MAG: hypothetical protein QNK23_03355 [Crocinitomicaceae bacterium]|nr:hypothetical protein [Crocinitomicaceae bacterium]